MLMTTREAAVYLTVSPAFLEAARTYGGGPRFVKLGRRVAYRTADLDAWIEDRVRGSTSEDRVA